MMNLWKVSTLDAASVDTQKVRVRSRISQMLDTASPPLYHHCCHHHHHHRHRHHQTSHFFTGFILVPAAHWKSLENSRLLENGPWTLRGKQFVYNNNNLIKLIFNQSIEMFTKFRGNFHNIWRRQLPNRQFFGRQKSNILIDF